MKINKKLCEIVAVVALGITASHIFQAYYFDDPNKPKYEDFKPKTFVKVATNDVIWYAEDPNNDGKFDVLAEAFPGYRKYYSDEYARSFNIKFDNTFNFLLTDDLQDLVQDASKNQQNVSYQMGLDEYNRIKDQKNN